MLLGDNGILQKATQSKEMSERAEIIETAQMDILGKQTENHGSLSEDELVEILTSPNYNTHGTLSNEKSILDRILTSNDGKYEIKVSEIYKGILDKKKKEPGLYDSDTDELKISWNKLLEDGILEDNGGTLKMTENSKDNLVGKLIISNTITSIDSLLGCNLLTSIEIPESVIHINNSGAFVNQSNLKSITISGNIAETKLYFQGDTNLTTIILGSEDLNKGMKTVGDFSDISNVENIIMKDSITSIGNHAFAGRTSIKNVTMSRNTTNIGKQAFAGCIGITSIIISDKVITIDEQAFASCTSISSISIPENVSSIAYNAFHSWTSSQTINVLGYTSKPDGYVDGWSGNANVVWKSE